MARKHKLNKSKASQPNSTPPTRTNSTINTVIQFALFSGGGLLAFGTVLDALSNALTIITPRVTIVGTIIAAVLALVVMTTKKLTPRVDQRAMYLDRLQWSNKEWFALVGIVFLLWTPYWLPAIRGTANQPNQDEYKQEKPVVAKLSIEGPPAAPLGKTTYYTIINNNAVRGVWSVGGFQNEPVNVDPLGPSHQIFIEPTDAKRVGESFTIVFRAYDANGKSVTAMKRFVVVAE